jgi:hypothetical protein
MNLRLSALPLLATLLAIPVFSQTSPPDEHKHWAEVTHKFETAPLDDDAKQEAGLTVSEIAVSGFHVVMCPEFYSDFGESKYEHHAEIRWLYMLGAATYQVETGKTDPEGTNLYALHSVLKGYAAILRQEPTAKDKTLEDFAKSDAKGKLADLIAKKGCK